MDWNWPDWKVFRMSVTDPPLSLAGPFPTVAAQHRIIMATPRDIVERLRLRGVRMPAPETVTVDPALPVDHLAPGVELHPGCRLVGADTWIGPGCILGREGPLTVENSQLQRDVALGGGYVSGATMLAGVAFGADAHIRPGTLLEEQSSGGHAVGLKQTILLPFVATGSLVNLCDVLMAGGTNRKNHSEVGSSYVHFNFTPNQDKATASLIGDVPRGVMLDQPPIFLGGQGGLVGPARIAYGTVAAAGAILRGDHLTGGTLVYGKRREGERPLTPGVYTNARRLVRNNLIYLGNLHALHLWYRHVRSRWLGESAFDTACLQGALTRIDMGVHERIERLGAVAERLANADDRAGAEAEFQRDVGRSWPELAGHLSLGCADDVAVDARSRFLDGLPEACTQPYLDAIRALDPSRRQQGSAWLQSVVDTVSGLVPTA